MRIAMLGAGAIGSLVGMFLQEGGADVVLVDPNKEHMKKISEDGLHMTCLSGEEKTIRMRTYFSGDEAGEADLVILLVNGMISEKVLASAGKLIGPNTVVYTPQNGLGQEIAVQKYIPDNRILIGCLGCSSIMKGPGEIFGNIIRRPGKVHMYVGCLDPKNGPVELAKQLVDYGNAGNFVSEYSENPYIPIWEKAVNNVTCNALCGISRVKIGEMYEYGKSIHNGLLRELVAVANAKGVPLSYEDALKNFEEVILPGVCQHYPSTAQNIFNKVPTDIYFLNGAISRFGKELGIDTPYNDVITGIISIIENHYDTMYPM